MCYISTQYTRRIGKVGQASADYRRDLAYGMPFEARTGNVLAHKEHQSVGLITLRKPEGLCDDGRRALTRNTEWDKRLVT